MPGERCRVFTGIAKFHIELLIGNSIYSSFQISSVAGSARDISLWIRCICVNFAFEPIWDGQIC
jgi:hypothetical protein